MESEFKFMGLSIPLLTIAYGLFLVIWGASVSLATQSQSITSCGDAHVICGFIREGSLSMTPFSICLSCALLPCIFPP